MRPTNIILVRHGHVEGINPPRFRGRTHLQLTAVGLRQAEKTSEYVAQICPHPHGIYSSPLTRCITTASIIGRPAGLAPIPDDGLIDIDYGSWQGRLVADVERDDPEEAARWFRLPSQAKIPNGESLLTMSKRVLRTLEKIIERNAGETSVIVGHDSTNRVILLNAFGMSLDRYQHISQSACAVTRLNRERGDWRIESMNETAHLMPTLAFAR